AAWRTDEKLRVLEAVGTLWNDLGYTRELLPGADLSGAGGASLPSFLLEIDFCDTMAGMTLHTALQMNGQSFSVTVEPFLDERGRIVGTVGMIRRAPAMVRDVNLNPADSRLTVAD